MPFPLPGLQVPDPYSPVLFGVGLESRETLISGVPSPAACQDHLGMPRATPPTTTPNFYSVGSSAAQGLRSSIF